MTMLRVEWEPDDKGTPPEVIDVPQEVYEAGIVDGGDSVSDWLSDTYGYLVRDWTAHDPLAGVDNGPCDDFAPDTLGDDPQVCTTCFYAAIDHAATWLVELFEYEYCAECGGDAEHHTAVPLFGNWFARCDYPPDDDGNYHPVIASFREVPA